MKNKIALMFLLALISSNVFAMEGDVKYEFDTSIKNDLNDKYAPFFEWLECEGNSELMGIEDLRDVLPSDNSLYNLINKDHTPENTKKISKILPGNLKKIALDLWFSKNSDVLIKLDIHSKYIKQKENANVFEIISFMRDINYIIDNIGYDIQLVFMMEKDSLNIKDEWVKARLKEVYAKKDGVVEQMEEDFKNFIEDVLNDIERATKEVFSVEKSVEEKLGFLEVEVSDTKRFRSKFSELISACCLF